jgi:DNA sulfur modification protein DndC
MSDTGRLGLTAEQLAARYQQIRDVYCADGRPWVIGYSGGKDSTTALQLIWHALAELSPDRRTKPVFVIASDTLVETPQVAQHVDASLTRINEAAKEQRLPFSAHKVSPRLEDSFG